MIVGTKGPAVVLSGRACAFLERFGGLAALRVMVRGRDDELAEQLADIRRAADGWRKAEQQQRGSDIGTAVAEASEPAAPSTWVSASGAAVLLGISPRAVVKAIARGDLPTATRDGNGPWRIERDDVRHYRERTAS